MLLFCCCRCCCLGPAARPLCRQAAAPPLTGLTAPAPFHKRHAKQVRVNALIGALPAEAVNVTGGQVARVGQPYLAGPFQVFHVRRGSPPLARR